MKEWHRTVVLFVLLAVAAAMILYLKGRYQTNFLDFL